jgi:hypothetical protein
MSGSGIHAIALERRFLVVQAGANSASLIWLLTGQVALPRIGRLGLLLRRRCLGQFFPAILTWGVVEDALENQANKLKCCLDNGHANEDERMAASKKAVWPPEGLKMVACGAAASSARVRAAFLSRLPLTGRSGNGHKTPTKCIKSLLDVRVGKGRWAPLVLKKIAV